MASNVSSLLSLNDDCLYAIFDYMEIKDQINLASCCRRLTDVFVMRAKVEHNILDLNVLENLSALQMRAFFQMAGPHIKELMGPLPCYHLGVIELIGTYCINVKSISLSRQYMRACNLRKLLKNTHLVEELNLNDVELNDKCITVLKKLKKLKKLSLRDNYALTGRDIKCLTTIEALSLNGCISILPSYLKEICKNLTDLKYLDIQECSFLKSYSLRDIVNHLQDLETIKLSYNNDQIDCIASLPCLKNLHLCGDRYGSINAEVFKEPPKIKADQLEILEIPNTLDLAKITYIGEMRNLKKLICPNNKNINDTCLRSISELQTLEMLDIQNCSSFTAAGLLDVIKNCKKLKTLDISHCEHLDEKFVKMVLELLMSKRKQGHQNEPLNLIAHYSGIQLSAVKSLAFQEVDDVLSISFAFDLDHSLNDYSYLQPTNIYDYFCGQDEADVDECVMFFSDTDDVA